MTNPASTPRRRPRTYPRGLKRSGKELWDSMIDEGYTFDPAEKVVLVQLCKSVGAMDRIDADLAEMGATVSGSTGQPRPNPLLKEKREQAIVIERLARALALPVGGETQGKRRSPEAKAEAKAPTRRVPSRRDKARVAHLVKGA